MIPAWFDVGVLTVVVLALLVLMIRRLLRVFRPAGSRRVAVILFVIPAAAFGWALAVEVRHQVAQAQATAVTRELTGNPDAVAVCQRLAPDLLELGQQAGEVSLDHPEVAQLRRTTCNDFFSWLTSDHHDPTPAQISALHVVVHEAMHVAGEYNEARTECWAVQHDAQAAEFLGASPADAQALAQAYYLTVYPRMPDAYRSADCVADGSLDLSPGDGRFP